MKAECSLGKGETCLKNKNVNSILTADFKTKPNYQFSIKLNCCPVEAIENFEQCTQTCVILCFIAEDFVPLEITSEETKVCHVLSAVLCFICCVTQSLVCMGYPGNLEAHTCTESERES